MALAKTLKFGQQYLLVSNGATTPVYSPLCGATSWTLTVNIEGNTTNIPDCEDPDLVAWLGYDEVSKQMVFTADGVLDTDAMQELRDWVDEGGPKTVRWMTEGTSGNGGGYYTASVYLSSYVESGQRGQRWGNNYGLTVDGKPVFTPAA